MAEAGRPSRQPPEAPALDGHPERTLHVGDAFVCGVYYGKVRAMIDDRGQKIEAAPPAFPVEILGLQGVPQAGDSFVAVADEAKARQVAEQSKAEIEAKNRDLAEAKVAAEAARALADDANKAKSQFLASMSHELRTPLNAIIGYSEMMEEEAPEIGAESMVPDLRKVQAAAKHQLGLINDILDLSKIEAGKMTLFIEEFDIAKLIQEVAATVQPLVAKKENRLVVECASDSGTMRAELLVGEAGAEAIARARAEALE